MSDSITLKAYGKLNLLLDIVGKLSNGYHTLKSVFQSVSVYDLVTVELVDGDKILIECDDKNVPTDSSNLVYKACERFFEFAQIAPCGVKITIEKHIPAMAGMAGGSSDCAATLVALDKLLHTNFSVDALCDIGVKLGADVPFCLTGGTVLCEGIGEIMTRLPDLKNCYFAVVKPDLCISTPESYKKFDSMVITEKSKTDDMIAGLVVGNIDTVSNCLYNALEISSDYEEIKNLKKSMLENGALGSLMTGSGSAVFGVYHAKREADACVKKLKKEYPFAEVVKPVDKGWEILD